MFIEKKLTFAALQMIILYTNLVPVVVLNCLEHHITIVLNWFNVNPLKANPPKFQFVVLGRIRKVPI